MKTVFVLTAAAAVVVTMVTGRSLDSPGGSSSSSSDQPLREEAKALSSVEGRGEARALALPPPVQVTSAVLTVKGDKREGRMIEIGDDGIPIIHGVREPDDPNDTQVYRNARIINNKLWTAEDEAKAANQIEGRSLAGESEDPGARARQPRVLNLSSRVTSSPLRQQMEGGFLTSLRDTGVASSSSSTAAQAGKSGLQYPEFYFKRYYNNERTGVVAESSFEDDSVSTSSEQVVSYSYLAASRDTSGAGGSRRGSDDVVYGSGSAAKPPKQNLARVTPSVVYESPKTTAVFSSSSSPSLPNAIPFSHSTSSSFAIHQDDSPVSSAAEASPAIRFPHASAASSPPAAFQVNPGHFIIKESTFQAHPGAPAFSVPIPVPADQAKFRQAGHRHQIQAAASDTVHHVEPLSSYSNYNGYQETPSKKPIYQKMIEPFKKVGQRFYEVASPVLRPVMKAGHRLSERLQLPQRMSSLSQTFRLDTMNDYISRTVDGESLPLVAGVTAIAALGLLGLAVAASTNSTSIGKRSVNDPTLEFMNQLVEAVPVDEPSLLHHLEQYASWGDTGCSRRIFCDIVSLANDDLLYAVEKRLGLFLSMLNRGSAEESSLKRRANDVMQAVRRRECQIFTCGGDQVDSSQVLRDSSGPR